MAYADLDDLTARFPRALTPAEIAQAEIMLDDASFLLSVKAPGLEAAVEAGEQPITHAAMLLTVTMVRRALLAQAASQTINPAIDSVSEAFGPYSSSIKYRGAGGELYLYDAELEYLLGMLRGDMAAATSMRSPGL